MSDTKSKNANANRNINKNGKTLKYNINKDNETKSNNISSKKSDANNGNVKNNTPNDTVIKGKRNSSKVIKSKSTSSKNRANSSNSLEYRENYIANNNPNDNINNGNTIEYKEVIKSDNDLQTSGFKHNSFRGKLREIRIEYLLICFLILIIVISASAYGISRVINNSSKDVINITNNAAENYFYSGKYQEAINEYASLHNKDEENPLWLVKEAEVYSVKGDADNSEKYVNMAKGIRDINSKQDTAAKDKESEEKDIEVANLIILTEYMNKDYKDALDYGQQCLEKYKDSKTLMKTMITIYMGNSQLDKAKRLIDNYPVDKKSSYELAEYASLKLLEDQWDEGLSLLRQAWGINKDEYKIFDILAQVSNYNRDLLLQKLSALSVKDPEEPAYKMWLAKIYSMSSETADMAQQQLSDVSNKDVGKFEKVLIQASIYQNSGKKDSANAIIDHLIQSNSNDYRIYHTAGWFYLQNKKYDEALKYCKMSILKNKDYPDNYGFLMPEILKAMGKNNGGAEAFFRTALEKEPYNYHILNSVANYYSFTTNNSIKALEYFHFAEMLKPNDPDIKYNMAMIDINNKQFDVAVNTLEQCVKLDESVPKYHRTLGTIYMQQKKYELAIVEIKAAYEDDNEDIMALNNEGCYYIMVDGDINKGKESLQKAAEGIDDDTDDYTKQTIKDNLKKAVDLADKYSKGSSNELITVPEFVLFY